MGESWWWEGIRRVKRGFLKSGGRAGPLEDLRFPHVAVVYEILLRKFWKLKSLEARKRSFQHLSNGRIFRVWGEVGRGHNEVFWKVGRARPMKGPGIFSFCGGVWDPTQKFWTLKKTCLSLETRKRNFQHLTNGGRLFRMGKVGREQNEAF